MSKGNHSTANRHALVVLADSAVALKDHAQLVTLQASATDQLAAIPRLEREAAARAILAGLTLHRVKASLPHGEFGKWTAQISTGGGNLPKLGHSQIANYMRLATTFVGKAKVTKPDLLALPGDQTQLALEGGEGEARAFMGKLAKFVAHKSLNELLTEHGIKGGKKLGGKREADTEDDAEDTAAAIPTTEELAAQTRNELADWLEQGRQLLLRDNVCARLSAEEIRNFAASLDDMLAHWRRGLRSTLAAAGIAGAGEVIETEALDEDTEAEPIDTPAVTVSDYDPAAQTTGATSAEEGEDNVVDFMSLPTA